MRTEHSVKQVYRGKQHEGKTEERDDTNKRSCNGPRGILLCEIKAKRRGYDMFVFSGVTTKLRPARVH